VDLVSHTGNFVARGLYNGRSKIRVRLYSWDPAVPLDSDFFRGRLADALRLRALLGLDGPGRACRLVFSEGDGLSGCTVDRYDRWLVLQFTGLGLARRRDLFVELLQELAHPEGIYLRTERGIGRLEGLELHDGPLWGQVPAEPIAIEEDGLRFLVNLAEGQKTGFYLDQRDNRRAVARLAAGRRVLDAFCYTGGFGLHAARAGARAVLGVDQSEPALALARANADRNGLAGVEFVRADVFAHLDALAGRGERFGLVVLDPPKFARARNALEEALRGYRRLQTLALRLLEPDGFLVTCCCSGLITADMLEEQLAQLAAEEKWEIQLLEQRGAAGDHPVSVSCLESRYLKCLVARVR
jgi:23S rRNA (cytosine1962-C5)-methyltransferase